MRGGLPTAPPSRVAVGLALLLSVLLFPISVATAQDLGATFFQTNEAFDPRIGLDVDFVVVHQHGNPNVGDALASWKQAGYPVGRMFIIGSDAGRIYTTGKFDGKDHTDEAETDRRGNPIECNGERPYMVPTEGWKNYIRFLVKQSVDAGAGAVLPEEPLGHTRSGYSPAFKRIWEERLGEPWRAPHTSPEAFFKANRLNSDLYFELVEDALETTKAYAAEKGREVGFFLPIHCLLSNAAGRMLYASGRTLSLSEKGLDGFVAQVWTGPVAWSMSQAEGEPMGRDKDFFESAYLLYSYFANLVEGTGLPCYLLADPVEDDPQYSWSDYASWYKQSFVAMTMFPSMNRFEVMPWPDRVFLPGYNMASGTPGPEDYRRSLMCAFSALGEISELPAEDSQKQISNRIGFLVADTLSWQMGGPESASMASVHGLTVPLLRRGIPIQIVPLERHGDRDFMDRFHTLILTYDPMKPVTPQMNVDLAAWVLRGGNLVVIGGADLYNKVDEWWSERGFKSPLDHLWEVLDIWKREDERFVFQGPREIRSATTYFNVIGLDKIEIPRDMRLVDYHFTGGTQIYKLLGERGTPDCGVVTRIEKEKGSVVFCGLPSHWFAESKAGGEMIHRLAAWNPSSESGLNDFKVGVGFQIARGEMKALRSCEKPIRLEGTFLDVMDSDLPVLANPELGPWSLAFYKDLGDALAPDSERSRILFGGPGPQSVEETPNRTGVTIRSPEGTPVTLRLARRGNSVGNIQLKAGDQVLTGTVQKFEDEASDTVLFVFQTGFENAVLEIDWRDKT
jgi:hypothetical protein